MKNTTAEIVRNKKINKKSYNHHEKTKREQITSSNISLKGSCPSKKFIKIENNIKSTETSNKNSANTTRNPYLSSNIFNNCKGKSDQWMSHRIDTSNKPEELWTINSLKLEKIGSPNEMKTPFYSSYEAGINTVLDAFKSSCEFGRILINEIFNKKIYAKNYAFELPVN